MYYDISFVDCAVVTGYRQGNAATCPGWDRAVEISGVSSGSCKKLTCGVKEMCM